MADLPDVTPTWVYPEGDQYSVVTTIAETGRIEYDMTSYYPIEKFRLVWSGVTDGDFAALLAHYRSVTGEYGVFDWNSVPSYIDGGDGLGATMAGRWTGKPKWTPNAKSWDLEMVFEKSITSGTTAEASSDPPPVFDNSPAAGSESGVYWEITIDDVNGNPTYIYIGISTAGAFATDSDLFGSSECWLYEPGSGSLGAGRKTWWGIWWAWGEYIVEGDVVSVLLDDNGNIYFAINGTWQDNGTAAFTNVTGTVYPVFGYTGVGQIQITAHFDEEPFNYTYPSGYTHIGSGNWNSGNISAQYTLSNGNLTIAGAEIIDGNAIATVSTIV